MLHGRSLGKRLLVSPLIALSLFVMASTTVVSLSTVPAYAASSATAQNTKALYDQAVRAYGEGKLDEALNLFDQVLTLDANFVDASYNRGAILYQMQRYTDALTSFNNVLKLNPNDHSARYSLGLVYEKLGQPQKAQAAFELIPSSFARYADAKKHIQANKQAVAQAQGAKPATPAATATTTPVTATKPATTTPAKPAMTTPPETATKPVTTPATVATKPVTTSTPAATKPTAAKPIASSTTPAATKPAATATTPGKPVAIPAAKKSTKAQVHEFATGLSGPTGLAMDKNGVLYVANFSKNTITKIGPKGEKIVFAQGAGINGPVGMVIDETTGDLYVASHLDNALIKITPDGKVSVVASGLKKPYNLFFDKASRTVFVSQQESNSVARVKLPTP